MTLIFIKMSALESHCFICASETELMVSLECPGKHQFCILCVQGIANQSLHAYNDTFPCPMCRHEVSKKSLEKVFLSEKVVSVLKDKDTDVWCYSGRQHGWWAFEPQMNEELEKAYQEYLSNNSNKTHKLKIGTITYTYDFEKMIQVSDKGNIRKICKSKTSNNSLKGIAGLQISPV